MLVCFGLAWPVSIVKSYKAGTNKGKSLLFLIVVFSGYISGIMHKIFFNFDSVVILYILNCFMVGVDILLYFRNSVIEKKKPC